MRDQMFRRRVLLSAVLLALLAAVGVDDAQSIKSDLSATDRVIAASKIDLAMPRRRAVHHRC